MSATAIKRRAGATNGLAKYIAEVFDCPESQIYTYDHCQSEEEIEFESYFDFVKRGMPEENAKRLAKETAKTLWELSKGEISD